VTQRPETIRSACTENDGRLPVGAFLLDDQVVGVTRPGCSTASPERSKLGPVAHTNCVNRWAKSLS